MKKALIFLAIITLGCVVKAQSKKTIVVEVDSAYWVELRTVSVLEVNKKKSIVKVLRGGKVVELPLIDNSNIKVGDKFFRFTDIKYKEKLSWADLKELI